MDLTCYLCASEGATPVKEVNGITVMRCPSCNLRFVHKLDPDVVERFYGERYFNNDSKMGYQNYLGDENNHRQNARRLLAAVHAQRDLTRATVVDVGCSAGFLLDEARESYGCRIRGVELSEYARGLATGLLGAGIVEAGLEDVGGEFFDVAFMAGTIEHLLDPREMLFGLNRLLKPRGMLVVTTIDTRGLLPLYSIKPPEHLFYFDHNNIGLLLSQAGFDLVLHRTAFVDYRLADLLHRLQEFTGLGLLGALEGIANRLSPRLALCIPTNEMLCLSTKKAVPSS